MPKKMLLIVVTACMLAALPQTSRAGCGGGSEGRSNSAQSESSTPPTGFTPGGTGGTGGTAPSGWSNVTISWDHDHVEAQGAAILQQQMEQEAQRQEMEDRLDQQALDFLYDDSQDQPTQAEIDRQRQDHIWQQLGNPDEASQAAIRHDFPTLESQEAMIGILSQLHTLDQRQDIPPAEYQAMRQELIGYYQDLQDDAASDRFNQALNFGLSVAVNVGTGAVGGPIGFGLGFTYNMISGGTRNAATGAVISVGSNAVQSLVPGYAFVAPVADAYAQDKFNRTLEGK